MRSECEGNQAASEAGAMSEHDLREGSRPGVDAKTWPAIPSWLKDP